MLCCPGCGGRFFKTLELRFNHLKRKITALLYKKRCKRCKTKMLVEMTLAAGHPVYAPVDLERWRRARRLGAMDGWFPATSAQAMVSDYTRFISTDTGAVFQDLLSRERRNSGGAGC